MPGLRAPALPDTGEIPVSVFKFFLGTQTGELGHRLNMRPIGAVGRLAACCLPARGTAVTAALIAPVIPTGAGPVGLVPEYGRVNTTQAEKVRTGRGFFAALDQSGGSTPKALAEYGIGRDRYSSDAEMFDLVHAMRARVLTSPAFDGSRVLAAILFEQTMERDVRGVPTARYLRDEKNVVPFLKVDQGLAPEQDGVQLMKPIEALDDLLERAQRHQIFGTKMRSVVNDADEAGISAIVDQQFDYASRILAAGLVPIIEPEVSISSPRKEQAETLLRDAIAKHVDALPEGATVMLKVTIPTRPGLYGDLASDPRVLRVVALSGGYSRDEACARLARDPTLIASFSRALLEGLTENQTDEQFNAQLESSIEQIYQASVHKQPTSP